MESGLKPLYRGVQAKGTPESVVAEAKDVLRRARREEGVRKRRNAEMLRDKLRRFENMRGLLRLRLASDR
jgi:hypothetical protein